MIISEEDKIISHFLNSLGPWKNFVVIGGGYAPIIYKTYFTDKNPGPYPVKTTDIDSLIPRKTPEVSSKNIRNYLKDAGFSHFFRDLDQPPTESYIKEIDGIEIEIEFLTDSKARHHKYSNVSIAGVVAQPISYLTMSLNNTRKFQTCLGESGTVVSPGAWTFHKGLTFTKRKGSLKKYKDLYGIWYVASQLGEFSHKAIEEFITLRLQHPKWFKTFQNNIEHWLENVSPLDWSKLEAQDPSGTLRKLHFESTISKILKI